MIFIIVAGNIFKFLFFFVHWNLEISTSILSYSMTYINLFSNRFFLPVFVICLLICSGLRAQSDIPDYKNNPVWIKMMDDPYVNYYEAIKAFEMYWQGREKPADEEEEMAEGKDNFKEMEREIKKEKKKDSKIVLTDEELKKKNDEQEMRYQLKRFKQWKREVKPFVQEDGHILSDEERMEIWKKQQQEIQNQQK